MSNLERAQEWRKNAHCDVECDDCAGEFAALLDAAEARGRAEGKAEAQREDPVWTKLQDIALEIEAIRVERDALLRVARAAHVIEAALDWCDEMQECHFCTFGEPDDDGGDQPHNEECPLLDVDPVAFRAALAALNEKKENT